MSGSRSRVALELKVRFIVVDGEGAEEFARESDKASDVAFLFGNHLFRNAQEKLTTTPRAA